jgi:glutathione synthase/RimK-type ligase-like ATP-grasp enzyme
MYIYPYKNGSQSVAALADSLEAKIIKLESSKFKGSKSKFVINWGNSMPNKEVSKSNVLNKPEAVAMATDKLTFFNAVSGQVSIPPYTTTKDVAEAWLNENKKIVVREKLNSHSGDGIVIIDNQDVWNEYDHRRAKMYVMYIPKKDEYRVHVMNGEAFDIQKKAVASGVDKSVVNYTIRNHHNGFIYVRDGVRENCPSQVIEEAINAIRIIGLDFGAVDVIYNKYRNQAFVLEVNTAPGLEGQSVTNYNETFTTAFNALTFTSRPISISSTVTLTNPF